MRTSNPALQLANSTSGGGLSLFGLSGALLMWSAATSTTADAILILGGLLLVVAAWMYPEARNPSLRSHHAIALLVAIVTVSRFLVPGGLMALTWVRVSLLVSVLAIFIAWVFVIRPVSFAARMALVLIIATISGVMAVVRPPPALDVYRIHIEAGRLVADGQNPYTAMDIPQDMTQPERFRITGYAYPPLLLIAYALPSIVVDPRWVSTAWWVLLVGLIGRRAARNPYQFWLVIVMITSPLVVPLLLITVTEPFVAALLILGVEAYGRRASTLNSFLLGLTMGTKQHVPTGLLGTWREVGWSRGWIVSVGAAVALASGFLISPTGYLRATIEPAFTSEPFELAASLYGLTGGFINVPSWMAFALAVPVGWLVARRQARPTVLPVMASTTIVIALAPLVTWTNWVLIMALAVYAHVIRSVQRSGGPLP